MANSEYREIGDDGVWTSKSAATQQPAATTPATTSAPATTAPAANDGVPVLETYTPELMTFDEKPYNDKAEEIKKRYEWGGNTNTLEYVKNNRKPKTMSDRARRYSSLAAGLTDVAQAIGESLSVGLGGLVKQRSTGGFAEYMKQMRQADRQYAQDMADYNRGYGKAVLADQKAKSDNDKDMHKALDANDAAKNKERQATARHNNKETNKANKSEVDAKNTITMVDYRTEKGVEAANRKRDHAVKHPMPPRSNGKTTYKVTTAEKNAAASSYLTETEINKIESQSWTSSQKQAARWALAESKGWKGGNDYKNH